MAVDSDDDAALYFVEEYKLVADSDDGMECI